MREFLPDILTWSVLSEPHGYDFNGALVIHSEGNLCIDPVDPNAEVLAQLVRRGVSQILITNRNHTRSAIQVHESTGAPIVIHPDDADYAKKQGVAIGGVLAIGERIGPFEVIACPGKSPGEVAFYDASRGLLVVGDAVIGNPPQRLSLLHEKVMDDPTLLRVSVRHLLDLDFDAILVGDGESLKEGARQRLEELVASFASD
jgi:glyoxylase-like metal-dependent hydrolase (beta-lactamase superfamily II)